MIDWNELKERATDFPHSANRLLLAGAAMALGITALQTLVTLIGTPVIYWLYNLLWWVCNVGGCALLAFYAWGIYKSGLNRMVLVSAGLMAAHVLLQILLSMALYNLLLLAAILVMGYDSVKNSEDINGGRLAMAGALVSFGLMLVTTLLSRSSAVYYGGFLHFVWVLLNVALGLSRFVALCGYILLLAGQMFVSPISPETVSGVSGAAGSLLGEATDKLKDAAEKYTGQSSLFGDSGNGQTNGTEPYSAGTDAAGAAPEPFAEKSTTDTPAAADPAAEEGLSESAQAAAAMALAGTHGTLEPGQTWEYKTVPGPAALTIGKNDDFAEAVRVYGGIIQKESTGDWEFSHIREVPVTKNYGCLAALLGNGSSTQFFNMLVFRRPRK